MAKILKKLEVTGLLIIEVTYMFIQVLDRLGLLERLMTYYFFRKILGNDRRLKVWRLLGASIEDDVRLSPGVTMRFPKNVSIGSGSSLGGKKVWIDAWGKVSIGRNVLMNDDIYLYSAGHPIDSPDFTDGTEFISIGDYVWMPHHIIVLPGVTIGNYAVIGTGALVSNDVPDYGVAVGNPAKVVKERARIKYTYIPSHF